MTGAAGAYPQASLRLGVLTLAHALGTLSIASVLVLAPALQDAFALNQTRFGLMVSCYYASQFLLAIPVGFLIDRIGVRRGLLLSHVLGATALALLSLAQGLGQACLALALMGVAYSLLNPATSKGVFDWMPLPRRGMGMGIKQTGVPAGALLAAGLAALAVGLLDWRATMQVGAGLIAAGALTALPLPASPTAAGDRRNLLGDARALLGNRRLHLIGLSNGIYNIGQIGLWSYVTLFLREALQAGAPMASLGFGAMQLFSAFGRIGWGRASDRYLRGRRWPAAVAIGCLAALGFVLLALPIGLGPALVVIALLGFTIGGYPGLMQAMAVESVEPSRAASAIGYNMLLVPAGAMIAPVLVGAMIDLTGAFFAGWLLLAGLVLAGGLLMLRAKD
ncbi:MFS transporter [Oceanibaculum pacificum]|uniref:Major facilitator superfamily (MFS) profile domain-containing protein n=1 Tax=Oceanibaculum pacificum TaxID=580166 RepID=A0A154W202_9PROT|nr:MFS transporter [Oceanibaculum pacificum]KZD07520.1 hypothetical protein AUP43_10125 [Oceanibaculum pacificum]